MKTIEEITQRLEALDIRLWLEDGRLRYSAPRDVLTAELKAELVARKAELLELLASQGSESAGSSPPSMSAPKSTTALPRARRDEPLVLSHQQRRMWVLDQLENGADAEARSTAYNLAAALWLTGRLDLEALERALSEIVRRHEVLRTTFVLDGEEPVQRIADPEPVCLRIVDLGPIPIEQREGAALEGAVELAAEPFDLAREWPFRLALFRVEEERSVLVLVMHHIASDGWSQGIFIREMSQLYRHFLARQGGGSPLPELAVQYADYAAWQKEALSSSASEGLLKFWCRHLEGAPPLSTLPADRPRPAVQKHRGGFHGFSLSASLVDRLNALGRRRRSTLFITLLTGFVAFLHRLTGQKDLVLGTPVAGRERRETENLIGFFVNTLALRFDLDGDVDRTGETFSSLLERVRATAFDAYDHQELPFERLVDELQLERRLDHTPLYQLMFVLQNAPQERLSLPGLSLEPFELPQYTAKFDLDFAFEPTPSGGLLAEMEFSTELFDLTTMTRYGRQFERFLRAIVEEPSKPWRAMTLLTQSERHALRLEWNDTAWDAASQGTFSETTLVGRIEAQAKQHPETTALIFDGECWSFAQLDERATGLAAELKRHGVGPDVLVGVCLERSFELSLALWSIWKAGGAYVPLDPDYPTARLAYMVENSRAPVILATGQTVAKLPRTSAKIIDPAGEFREFEEGEGQAIRRLHPENLAYVIYTSGSTGRPKGVGNSHAGILNRLLWKQRTYQLDPSDRVLQKTPYSFDVSVWEFFWPLLTGVPLVIARPDGHRDPVYLGELIHEQSVTTLHFVPSMLRAFLEAAPSEKLGSIRRVIASGEALTGDLVQRFSEVMPEAKLHNLYGPTEAAIDVTSWVCSPQDAKKTIPIGRPISGLRTLVFDRYAESVPVGVPGQLFLGGTGLARGYDAQPDLTAASFVPDPFSIHGERLYATGDLARHRADGALEFLGRIDHQVKIRGLRIELGEISAAMERFPGIDGARVKVLADGPGGAQRLVGYLASKADLDLAALSERLAAELPDYMVPGTFLILPELPLTPSGKVDVKALPAPAAPQSSKPKVRAAPRTWVEDALVDVWEEILGAEGLGIRDNFFTLGGDSIICIQMVTRARRQGIRLTPQQVFARQTIAELATVAVLSEEVRAEQDLVLGALPLTPIQREFFARQLNEKHHFNQSVLLETPEDFNPARADRAVASLLRHHDALRLRFFHTADGWQQEGAGIPERVPFAMFDLTRVEAGRQGSALTALANQIQASLVLDEGCLLRAAFFKLGPNAGRLLLIVHHLAVDGVSWRVLLEDFIGLCGREPYELPPKTTSFREWSHRLEELAKEEVFLDQARFWLHLRPSPELPNDFDSDSGLGRVGDEEMVDVALDEETTSALLGEANLAFNTQINDLLLSALARTFARQTGHERLLIDLEGHGREELFDDVDLGRTVGWFLALYPVAIETSAGASWTRILCGAKEALHQIPRRGVPFGIARWLGSAESRLREHLAALSRPQLLFNYLGQLDQGLSLEPFQSAKENAGWDRSPRGARSHLLEINAYTLGGRFHAVWTYSSKQHRRESIEALAQSWMEDLRALVAACLHPEAGGFTPSDFPLAGLDGKTLDRLYARSRDGAREIEDIYPLSPMQRGMLFESQYNPDSTLWFEQLSCTLRGALDRVAFRRAWRETLDRHATLRTSFLIEDLDEPAQVVWKGVDLPWREIEEGDAELLAGLETEDRRQGFRFDEVPLMRFTLVRLGEDRHRFLWSHHHMILDGWSVAVIFREVMTLYKLHAGDGSGLGLSTVRPYKDYIAWLLARDPAAAETFWRADLAGFEAPTPLPLAGSVGRGERAAGDFRDRAFALDAEATGQLSRLAKREQLTLATVVQGAWAVLLARHAGVSEVVFGATVSGRPLDLDGVENMVGLFINTLPVRVKVGASQELLPWLRVLQQRQVARDANAASLADVQRWSSVPPGVRLFESLLAFENYPIDEALGQDQESVAIEEVAVAVEEVNDPLSVQVVPGGALQVKISYEHPRFQASAILHLARRFLSLLTQMAQRPETRLADLELLMLAERQQIRVEWNANSNATAPEQIHHLFEAQAQRTPDAPAALDRSSTLSYRELDRRANRLAHGLQALGARAEERIGLFLHRTPDLMVGLLGILKSGAAYIPMDPLYPTERLRMMLEDGDVRAIVTEPTLLERLPEAEVVLLREAIAGGPDTAPLTDSTPENLAYIIFTSGSTGRPKGVAIEQRSLVAYIRWVCELYGREAMERVLATTSVCFDISGIELYAPICSGGAVVWVENALAVGEAGARISLINTVPSAAAALIRDDALPSSVQILSLGGERLEQALVDHLYHRTPVQRVFDFYGPTEDTIYSASKLRTDGGLETIGRPVAGSRAYLVDEQLHLVPAGVAGELLLGGPKVARGYFGRPELTAERFVPDPFALPGQRLYRTGDLVRQSSSGELHFLGRLDHQVKIRGFRIELGEIETVLAQHPGVLRALVVIDESEGDPRLIAGVTPDSTWRPDIKQTEQGGQRVAHWQQVWEDMYRESETVDEAFDLTGWQDSRTGEAIASEEMSEWVEETVNSILSLQPQRLLEIGCGAGLLLGRIAPHCELYEALDFSPHILRQVATLVAGRSDLEGRVRLHQKSADDLAEFEAGSYDTVVLNSVIQYFPSVDYLLEVLDGARRLLRPGGRIFIGDVRHRGLLAAHHFEVHSFQASPDLPLAELQQRIDRGVADEEELLLDPDFFSVLVRSWPQPSAARMLLKPGRSRNEMTHFRYDVTLTLGQSRQALDGWQDFCAEEHRPEQLHMLLAQQQPDRLGIRGVPNARVSSVRALELLEKSGTVADLVQRLEGAGEMFEPADYQDLAVALGYETELTFGHRDLATFDLRLERKGLTLVEESISTSPTTARDIPLDLRALVNDPQREKHRRLLRPALQEHLKAGLPDYMVPSRLVVVDRFPQLPNGKVDRKALAELAEPLATTPVESSVFRDPIEEMLAAIWCEVLGLSSCTLEDDFFALGGHSLLATQVISRLRVAFGLDLPVRRLFDATTLVRFAEVVRAALSGNEAEDAAPPLVAAPRSGRIPLSFAQQRLWFLDRLEGASDNYNMPGAFDLIGRLNVQALERSLSELVKRHEALRTSFPDESGEPYQSIAEPIALHLPVVDLTQLPESARESVAREHLEAEAHQPFDLTSGPVLRVGLLRLSARHHHFWITLHHIVADAWSLGVLVRELEAFYRSLASDTPLPDLAPLSVQYADFAIWQRRWLSGEALDRQTAWWRRELADAPPALDLIPDYPRAARRSYRGGSVPLRLSESLSNGLRSLARDTGSTLFMTALAGFAALLSRYSGQREVVIGTPIASRHREEIEPLIGFFVNSLALRVDLNRRPTVGDLLQRVRQRALDAYAHQDLPFERLVEALQLPRDLRHTPVFQAMLVLQNAPMTNSEWPDLLITPCSTTPTAAKFDLTLALEEEGAALVGELVYNADLYAADRMERMAGHLRVLFEALAESGEDVLDRRVDRLPLLSALEQQEILAAGSGGDALPAETLPDLFTGVAEARPEAVVGVFQNEHLSFGTCRSHALALAARLRSLGVRSEDRVGLSVQPSIEILTGLLGILQAGAAYVPLDPTYPRQRRRFMSEDAGLRHVVTVGEAASDLTDLAEIIDLREKVDPEQTREQRFSGQLVPEQLAYVIYTSGSTGRPKGVGVPHRAICNLARAQAAHFDVLPKSRFLQYVSFSFDVATSDIVTALSVGATVVFVDRHQLLLGAPLVEHLQKQRVTHAEFPVAVPAAIQDPSPLHALKTVVIGGEVCPPEVIARWSPGRRLINAYGPTEATVCATVGQLRVDETSSLGEAFPGVVTWPRSEDGALQPLDVAGEYGIGGTGLARGYLGRPALTAERYVPDDLSGVPGARLYRTGDRVVRRADGHVAFLGRTDGQIKIRGYRIEVGEVQTAIQRHPAVDAAIVAARKDAAGVDQLVAWVVNHAEGGPSAVELREFLGHTLPESMRPTAFLFLDAWPLTATGKIDVQALPSPEAVRSDLVESGQAAHGRTESILAEIWCEVLKLEQVGADSDFFTLGGHSLAVTRVASLVFERFGVELPLPRFFEAKTLAQLARVIDDKAPDHKPSVGEKIHATGRRQGELFALPMSFAQERLWLLDRLEPGASYAMPAALRLSGRLDQSALFAALREIVQRHEVLRTRFDLLQGVPVQVILPEADFEATGADLNGLNVADRDVEIRRWREQILARPFDLQHDALIRVCLLQLETEQHLLLLNLHHIVADGWSMGVLEQELSALYSSFEARCPSPLPTLELQYADFTLWQRQMLQGEPLQGLIDAWRGLLAGAPNVLDLPTDRPRPPAQTFGGASHAARLDADLVAALERLGQEAQATPAMVFLTAFGALLARLSGQHDLLIGSPIANRQRRELEPLIGCFVNTLAQRVDMKNDPSFTMALAHVREMSLAAYQHQDLPFERLVEALEPERDLSRSPLFQVMLIVQNLPVSPLHLPGLTVEALDPHYEGAKFDLTLYLDLADPDGAEARFEYNPDLFDASTVARWVEHFNVLLGGLVAAPHVCLSRLPLLSEAQKKQLAAWNRTDGYPEIRPLHALIDSRAETDADRVAVQGDGQELTFHQLRVAGDDLARRLISHGIRRGDHVAVFLDRSPNLVVALLGVMKAGAAYVPMDPIYPADRLAMMLEDAEVKAIVLESELVDQLPATDVEQVNIALDDARVPVSVPLPVTTAEDLAYVIFTSGSTGRPKGVQIAHRSLINFLRSMAERPGFTSEDTLLAVTTISFDIAGLELFLPLLQGGRVVIASREQAGDGEQLRQLLDQGAIQTLQATPATWRLLLAAGWKGKPGFKALCGGEALPGELAQQLLDLPGVELWNLYGPTETTIWSAAEAVRLDGESDLPEAVSLGFPIDATELHVLDAGCERSPIGVPGELWIGGDGLARGYAKRPSLTAERFVPNPFQGHGARLYQTGDLVRQRPDGRLDYLGRLDQQIKLRGFRIELGEIEARLNALSSVERGVVVAHRSAGDPRLVAYLESGQGFDVEALRSELGKSLPEYMIPVAFVALEDLPTTLNGKVDRKALAARELQPVARSSQHRAPRNALERSFVAIWEEVLEVRPIGIDDDFFANGGHSLLVIRLLDLMQKRLDITLPFSALFRTPTIAGLAVEQEPRIAKSSTAAEKQGHLVRLADGDSRPPLFIVPGMGGDPHYLRALAERLEQNVYGFSAFSSDGQSVPLESVEAISEVYVEVLEKQQPEGAIHLAGHSFGSRVAFAMANLLLQRGREIQTFFVLDTVAPVLEKPPQIFAEDDVDWMMEAVGEVEKRLGVSLGLTNQDLRVHEESERFELLRRRLDEVGDLPTGADANWLAAQLRFHRAAETLHSRPEPLSGLAVRLFKAHGTVGAVGLETSLKKLMGERAWGWERLCEQVIVEEVPGDHNTMLAEPAVGVLAGWLHHVLEESL